MAQKIESGKHEKQLSNFDLGAIFIDESHPDETADSLSKIEKDSFDDEKKKAELDSFKQDTKERKDYSDKIFRLVCRWLLGMISLLIFEGFLSVWGLFHLTEAVMLAAIGGTTVNVLGLFVIVANYLFPKRK